MARSFCVIIPAFNEHHWIPHTIHSLQTAWESFLQRHAASKLYVVVVVNQPTDLDDPEVTQNNRATVSYLKSLDSPFVLSVVDKTDGLKHGVGEARALGASYAIKHEGLGPQDLLLSLDADTTVEKDYFNKLYQIDISSFSGFTLGFKHLLNSQVAYDGITIYELYLRYMKWGLSYAGSMFDFYTIGSCLGTNVHSYILSGGFAKRPATEDFHFLNKLRKFGPIAYYPDIEVSPSSRKSSRVFLGTGHFLSTYRQGENLSLVVPTLETFDALKQILDSFRNYFNNKHSHQDVLKSTSSTQFFLGHPILERVERLRMNSATAESFRKKLPSVLDGLQILRLLKYLSPSTTDVDGFLFACRRFLGLQDTQPHGLLLRFRERDLAWSKGLPAWWPWQRKSDAPA